MTRIATISRRVFLVLALGLFAPPLRAQSLEPIGYFYVIDSPNKILYITEIQRIPDARKWENINYLEAFSQKMKWEKRPRSHWSGTLKYISRVSAYFERMDRQSYQSLIDRNRNLGRSIQTIALPKPISVQIKAAKASRQ